LVLMSVAILAQDLCEEITRWIFPRFVALLRNAVLWSNP
jgi:hypothetical protein